MFISVYVDISDPDVECSTLAFNFKDQEMTRQWNITIIQIPCDYENRAPPGCLQYHFGVNEDGVGGVIQSFNFDGGYHLADQDQEWIVFPFQALLYTKLLYVYTSELLDRTICTFLFFTNSSKKGHCIYQSFTKNYKSAPISYQYAAFNTHSQTSNIAFLLD